MTPLDAGLACALVMAIACIILLAASNEHLQYHYRRIAAENLELRMKPKPIREQIAAYGMKPRSFEDGQESIRQITDL